MRYPALRDRDGAIPDLKVAAGAYLASEDDVVANVGCAREPDLGAKQSVLADNATMANVDHVVEF